MSDEEANDGVTCDCGGDGIHKHRPLWKELLGIKHNYHP